MTEPVASRGRIYRSAVTAVLLQWSMRFIGLISVLVLARLLTPSDFGVIGIAMATLGLVEILSAIGLRQALLRIGDPTSAHLDTAWTIQVILFCSLAAVTVAAAPLASWAYGNPAIKWVIAALSLRFVFLGLVNIGVFYFEREFKFGDDLKMRISGRLASFFITLTAAALLRNYWALVVGLLCQSLFLMIGSYVMQSYRPRFSMAERQALLGFSVWMLIASMAQTAQQQAERLIAAMIGGPHLAGLYSVSKDLSEIFTQEIGTALNRITFVTIAASKAALGEDPARVARILGCYALIAAPAGLGLAATAEDSVAVLLGPQWTQAVPILKIVAIYSSLYAVFRVINSMQTAAGFAKEAGTLSISGALTTAGAALAAGLIWHSAIPVALAAGAGNLVMLLRGLGVMAKETKLPRMTLILHVARPFLAATLMCVVIRLLPVNVGAPLGDLAVTVPLGGSLYALFLAAIWIASGRPDGAEAEAVDVLRSLRLSERMPLLRKA